jgi:hypothetical protein
MPPDLATIAQRYAMLAPALDERGRRLLAATEAKLIGYGGVSTLSRISGLPRNSITAGIKEINSGQQLPPGRVRKTGGGRKRKRDSSPSLVDDLENLIEPDVRGDPESPLRWTIKSLRQLEAELEKKGHKVSRQTIGEILHEQGYSLQVNQKTLEGTSHPDRNQQFNYINQRVKEHLDKGRPVISVDTQKKEIIGNYENKGREWHFQGLPDAVNTHDFPAPDVPRAYPYGLYDLGRNTGFVNLGTDRDTAAFAVASLRRWWKHEGRHAYPKAQGLLVTADSGGSNGHRLRLWKWELQQLADELGIPISVCHFPPGTSKWNKVEHRLFSFISINWRGKPLDSYETMVNLISRTTTRTGLRVTCLLDKRRYPTGKSVSEKDYATLNLVRAEYQGDWNYTIKPRRT